MTTPERLRRRQRIEGTFLVIIGILLVVSTLWFRHQDEQQRACFTTKFSELTSNLSARGALASREARAALQESRATRLESRANSDFYRQAFAATSTEDVFEAYAQYRVTLATVNEKRAKVTEKRAEIKREREANPIPDFPEGTCDA